MMTLSTAASGSNPDAPCSATANTEKFDMGTLARQRKRGRRPSAQISRMPPDWQALRAWSTIGSPAYLVHAGACRRIRPPTRAHRPILVLTLCARLSGNWDIGRLKAA